MKQTLVKTMEKVYFHCKKMPQNTNNHFHIFWPQYW